jgi:hypothetical protein
MDTQKQLNVPLQPDGVREELQILSGFFPANTAQARRNSSGTLSCFWVSILPTIWPEVVGRFQA